MRYLLQLFFLGFVFSLCGQNTVTGVVTNDRGEYLSFATVFLENTDIAASTNDQGEYILTQIPSGSYSLKVTFIGYRSFTETITIESDIKKNITLAGQIYDLGLVEIQSNRVTDNGPFTKQNLNKTQLQKENVGTDVPYLLQWTPSMVVTSDAGTGIGYTGLRLRGSDQTRVNVTLNGIPVNDAESHNVFWVDLPDLMGSVNNIQIQRGVGTSTNGAGAFGGTVSINTADVRVNPYIDLAGTLGAFNTKKLSVNVGTGLINDRYTIDGRYSHISSAGFVDRATSDLNSLYFSAARITSRSSLRLNILSGKEVTYQSWYGVPEARVNGDVAALTDHYYNNLGSIYKTTTDSINLFSSGRRYNYYTYQNQVDNYRQTHYQLLHSLAVNKHFRIKTSLFYTKGSGYFEEFKADDGLEGYGINPFLDADGNEVSSTDIVRRRWLDNDLVGGLFDAEYTFLHTTLQAGIAVNNYIGDHFGNVIASTPTIPTLDRERNYYDNRGKKSDISSYFRAIQQIGNKFSLHMDAQVRHVTYAVSGIDNDLRSINVDDKFTFFNPKIGGNFAINKGQNIYLSLAIANKEPSRGDYVDQAFGSLPTSENLQNWELGYTLQKTATRLESNVYYMKYNNQLVLTGELNDVGAPIRLNVPNSYRLGWEGSVLHQLAPWLALQGNLTVSRNVIKSFDEVVFDYTVDFERTTINHTNTDISFSPSVVSSLQLLVTPIKHLEAEISSKYVGQQYLDNTSNDNRSLPSYHYQNLRLTYTVPSKFWKSMDITLLANNILDAKYASNGYTYSYIYGDTITENFLYPQAGRHVMLALKVGF